MKSGFIVSKQKYQVRETQQLYTGQTISYPVNHEKELVIQNLANEFTGGDELFPDDEFLVFEKLEDAEIFAEGLALDNYYFSRTDSNFNKASLVSLRNREARIGGRDEETQSIARELATDDNYLNGKCERMYSHPVVEVAIRADSEKAIDQVSKKDILFVRSAFLRDGNHEQVRYQAELKNKSFASLYNKRDPRGSYLNMIRKYNKGPCCGFFRNHKGDGVLLMNNIRKFFDDQDAKRSDHSVASLIPKLQKALKEPNVKPSGHFAQLLRDIIKLEVEREAEKIANLKAEASSRSASSVLSLIPSY